MLRGGRVSPNMGANEFFFSFLEFFAYCMHIVSFSCNMIIIIIALFRKTGLHMRKQYLNLDKIKHFEKSSSPQ